MPSRRTEDVIQAVMTDHRIVRVPEPESQRLAALPEAPPSPRTGEPRLYWDGHDANDPDLAFHLAVSGASTGNPSEIARLESFISDTGTTELAPLAELATLQLRQHKYHEAIATLKTILATYPDHGRVHVEMGLAQDVTGNATGALEHFNRALELKTPMPELHFGMGSACYHLGRIDEAADHFRDAVRLRPIYPEALLNLGLAEQVQGFWPESIVTFTSALVADPCSSLACHRLALAHLRLEDVPSALAAWKRGAKLNPADAAICEGLALALVLDGQAEAALAEAERGYRLQADEPSLLLVAALAQNRLGNRSIARQALQAARMAMQMAPSSSFVRSAASREAARIFGDG